MTTGGTQSNWKIGERRGGDGDIAPCALRRNLINLITHKSALNKVLRNKLPPLLRRNGLTTKNSLCSLRLPPFLLSPLAHNAPQKAICFFGDPIEARGGPD